jgi:Ca-activated chloride channel family protein
LTFASPYWLLALLLLPVLGVVAVWFAGQDAKRTARLVSRPLWARVVRRPFARWHWARLTLALLGAALLLLALARPQWGTVREKVEREGVDVVLALDTSASMSVEDVAPSRFFLARVALGAFLSRLEGDRVGLLAFEGEAYPLVPLTLDADAVGLFLDTIEPGIVPAPGTSLGQGLGRGIEMFVDEGRRNRVLVLVSDGEDLEGEVEVAVAAAKKAGVVVHTVGVGTEAGQPVPEYDAEGRRLGFKKDATGAPVISHYSSASLEAMARGTGGRFFRVTPADTSLSGLAAAIEGMERKSLAQEYSFRRKEGYQVPLAAGLGLLALGLMAPVPLRRLPRVQAERPAASNDDSGRKVILSVGLVLYLLAGAAADAGEPSPAPGTPAPNSQTGPAVARPQAGRGGGLVDELLLRPRRFTEDGREAAARGDHPKALAAFERAASARPSDPRVTFNLAGSLLKNGKSQEAEPLLRALSSDEQSPLAAAARFNLGNALYERQDYPGAIRAYRDALRVAPRDEDTRRNLELALRAVKEQKEKQPQQDKQQQEQKPQDKKAQDQQQKGSESPQQRPQTAEEKEKQRFLKEAGMPKERAMQILDALQRNEKAEQKKLLAAKRAEQRPGRDW